MLGKSDSYFSLFDARPICYRCEDVVHNGAPHACEDDDPVKHEKDVVPAQSVSSSLFIVVGDAEELSSVMSTGGERNMGKEQDGEQVDGNGCSELADYTNIFEDNTDLFVDQRSKCRGVLRCSLLCPCPSTLA